MTKARTTVVWRATVRLTLWDGSVLEPGDLWPNTRPPAWLVDHGFVQKGHL